MLITNTLVLITAWLVSPIKQVSNKYKYNETKIQRYNQTIGLQTRNWSTLALGISQLNIVDIIRCGVITKKGKGGRKHANSQTETTSHAKSGPPWGIENLEVYDLESGN